MANSDEQWLTVTMLTRYVALKTGDLIYINNVC